MTDLSQQGKGWSWCASGVEASRRGGMGNRGLAVSSGAATSAIAAGIVKLLVEFNEDRGHKGAEG